MLCNRLNLKFLQGSFPHNKYLSAVLDCPHSKSNLIHFLPTVRLHTNWLYRQELLSRVVGR